MKNKTSTKKVSKTSLRKGSVVALLIVLSPFIFYLYSNFPEGKIWETPFFTYETTYYNSIYIMAWILMGKCIPFLLLVLWFFTCKHWWRHAILIPIGMYAFQIFSILNDETKYFDVVEIWYVFPIMLCIVPVIYFIRAKLFAEVNGDNLEEFEKNLQKPQSFFRQLKELFN